MVASSSRWKPYCPLVTLCRSTPAMAHRTKTARSLDVSLLQLSSKRMHPLFQNCLSFNKQRCKSAIQMVMDWHRGLGLYEAELRNLTVDVCDDTFVFFRLNAAGTVDKATAGF